MTIEHGEYTAYDYDRMIVLFTMTDDSVTIPCAISTAAMDDIDGSTGTKASQREAQFMRLRDRIERQAVQKILKLEYEGQPPGIVLRSIDFRISD